MISIVMPVKNAAPYLKECIESIIAQTFSEWELLAVDDHSTDNSYQLIDEFSKLDDRIHLFNNHSHGIISALQTAYEASKGNMIHRMDADDIMPPKKLETLFTLLHRKGDGYIATGKVKYFAKNGISDGYLKYEKWLNNLVDQASHWDEVYKECVIASPAWLIHRKDFEAAGAFNSKRYPEDYDLVFRYYEIGLNITSSKEIVHLWRDHNERTSRNHIHYQANSFFALKLHYFLNLDYSQGKKLILWGAGKKGKALAKLLNEREVAFQWVSNNPNKHGKEIYEKVLASYQAIVSESDVQVIVTVAQRNAQKEIISFLNENNLEIRKDYYLFR